MSTVKVRFAPSPTGHLHIGNVRTALFNWLFARHNKGVFLLRIEDTDLERSNKESEEYILEDLRWLGLHWDEGIDVGGNNGPYRQTERLDIYHKYIEYLLQERFAYKCYCTEEELKQMREDQLEFGTMPKYDGKCRHLSLEEQRVLEQTRRPTIRFRVPDGQICFSDLIRNTITFDSETVGDFVIARSDGMPTYNFAVVIDDALMGITHVIRADEHIANTIRQVLLYKALGFTTPEFAHVSMILGSDRSKLSKRHGASSIQHYREEGYLPEALLNYLALLGWSDSSGEEILDPQELIARFSLDRIARSPAVFDIAKLRWMNSQYIKKESIEHLLELAVPHLLKAGFFSEPLGDSDKAWITQFIDAVRDHLEVLAQIVGYARVFFSDIEFPEDATAAKYVAKEEWNTVIGHTKSKLSKCNNYAPDLIHKVLQSIPVDLGFGMKKTFMPVRVALTGSTTGIELHNIVSLLGKDTTLKRLERALTWKVKM